MQLLPLINVPLAVHVHSHKEGYRRVVGSKQKIGKNSSKPEMYRKSSPIFRNLAPDKRVCSHSGIQNYKTFVYNGEIVLS